jgi:YcxB-like protein
MSAPITFALRYRPDEMRKALCAVARTHLRFTHLAAPATLLVAALFELYFGGSKYVWVAMFSAAIGLALLMRLYFLFLIVPRFKMRDDLLDEYQWTLSEDGIVIRGTSFEARLAWSYYKKATRLPQFYLLHRVYGYTVIPRRAFASDVETAAFETLLAAKLPVAGRVGE